MVDSTQSGRRGELLDPPSPFRQTAPGVLKLTRGGGVISLFGAPFFLVGVFMLLGAVGFVPMRTESGQTPSILAPMGFVFFAIGGVMVCGRQWLVLDLGRRSILRQIGLLVPLRTEEQALSEFHAVVISYKSGDAESPETYPVTLRVSAGKDIAIIKPSQFGESLVTAEYLARALSLQLIDATTDRETTISPGRIGESLRDRLTRAPAGTPPPRPPSMRSDITEGADQTRIVMPGGGPTIAGYAGLFLPIVVFFMAMLFAIPSLVRSTKPLTLLCMLLLLFGAPTVFGGVRLLLSRKREGVTITASSAGLVLEHPGRGKMQSTSISATDLFDVDHSTRENGIASARHSAFTARVEDPGNERVFTTLKKLIPNRGIVIKSRKGLITIGEGLPADELQYLAWLIRRAVIR